MGGDVEILHEMAGVFRKVWPEWLGEVRTAIGRHDAAGLRRTAHSVKGSLGQFGADAACAAALRLETMARGEDLAGAAEACAALEEELRRVESALARFAQPAP
jgi:HPt (histidine-containing phosphotransfer) domain-containing protein